MQSTAAVSPLVNKPNLSIKPNSDVPVADQIDRNLAKANLDAYLNEKRNAEGHEKLWKHIVDVCGDNKDTEAIHKMEERVT